MTVTTYREPQLPDAAELTRWVAILEPAAILADRIANTEFVPKSLRGHPDKVAACIMYGDEIGLGPMQSLAGIHVIEGKPTPSAELMRALIYRAGHSLLIEVLDGTRCRVVGKRHGDSAGTRIEWNVEMARRAGLLSRKVWQDYPRAMLLARATSELCRIVFPDVIKGLGHLPDDETVAAEFDEWIRTLPETEEPQPEPTATVTRRRRRSVATVELPVTSGVTGEAEAGTSEPPQATDSHGDAAAGTPRPSGTAAAVSKPSTARETVPEPLPEEPEPETPEPDDPGGVLPAGVPTEQISESQIRSVMAAFHRIGAENRDLRLEITRAAIGRRITSSLELSRHEALKLIRVLSDLEVGVLTLSIDPDGNVEILATETEADF